MMFNSRHFLFTALSCGLISVPAVGLLGQQSAAPAPTQQAQPAAGQGSGQGQEADPMRRQLSDKERYRAQKELRRELKGPYKTWLNEEVPYIITDDERKAFMSLANDEEREAFIENFWQRRNPNPDSPENEFREEHYRRIQYANDHFAAGKPGWKTDRGHIYMPGGRPTASTPIPRAACTSGPWKRAAARRRLSRSRCGTTAISRASARTSISSSWIPASAAITTSPSTAARRTL